MRKWIAATFAGVLMMSALPAWAAELAATLHWYRRVELGTPVSGVIAAVPVRPGDRVKRGQALVRLDARAFQAEVNKAGAVLDQRTQDRAEAKRALDRAQVLYAQTVLSTRELDLAKLRFATADARYRAARANLALVRLDLEHSVVRAPYDGIVLSRAAQVGQAVVSRLQSAPLVVLAEAGRMVARGRVKQDQLARLSLGQKVTVKVGTQRYAALIRRLGLEPVSGAGADAVYAVDAVFHPDPATVLRAGQAASLELP